MKSRLIGSELQPAAHRIDAAYAQTPTPTGIAVEGVISPGETKVLTSEYRRQGAISRA
jgi:hypothetical protein